MLLFLLSDGIVESKGSAKSVPDFGGRSLTVCATGVWLGQAMVNKMDFAQFSLF